MLLRAMIFATTPDIHNRIQRRCVTSGDIDLYRSPEYRPSASDMLRLINSYAPEMALIEFYDLDDLRKIEETLHAECPGLAIVGFADGWKHENPVKVATGCVNVISSSAPIEAFKDAVMTALSEASSPGPNNVLVFLPAKAGSGASTVALNVTGALANKCGKSTILIEADLHSGPAGMYLNLNPTRSVIDALAQSHNLEGDWPDMVTTASNFDLLPAYNIHDNASLPTAWAYRRLLNFARRRYEFVIFDLPEVVNHATEAIVTAARTVYVVCTPEVPSLMLARKRAAGLLDRGVSEDRVRIVLNRALKDGPDASDVAEILGYPIGQTLPNDYRSLWEANMQRRLVDRSTTVGRAFEDFASSLAGLPVAAKPARKLFGLFPAA
jgi:Flp pilus assembly CpaE family ATPase